METRASYVIIGAFVFIVVAGMLGYIILQTQSQGEFDEYDVVFRDRVSGLTVGAQVSFNGIQKGEVETLTIDQEDPSVVVARVRVERDTPIKTDTKAELELVGFTGLAIIQFIGGSPDQTLLKDTIRGVPSIEASAGGIAQIFEGSNNVIAAASRLLSDDNIQHFDDIMAGVDTIITAVAEEEESLGATVKNLAEITEDIASMTEQLDQTLAKLDALIGDDAKGALVEAEATMAEARALLKDLRGVVDENREPLAAFTDQGLAQVGPAMVEARRVFRTLDQVLREIDRDARGYLLGDSAPRYEATQE